MWSALPVIASVPLSIAWVLSSAITFYATVLIAIFLFQRAGKLPPLFKLWMVICFFAFSPWRYFVFQSVLFVTYAAQNWHTFQTSFIMYLYAPVVFMLPAVLGSLGIYYAALFLYSRGPRVQRLLWLSVFIPVAYVGATFVYFALLPFSAQTVYWLNPGEVVSAVRGPVIYAYKYLGAPGYPIRMAEHSKFWLPMRPAERHVAELYLKSDDRESFSRTITSEPLARPKSPPE